MTTEDEGAVCPGCGGALLHGGHGAARSRYDNETEVCSPCGVWEAMSAPLYGGLTAPGRAGERTRIDEDVVPFTHS